MAALIKKIVGGLMAFALVGTAFMGLLHTKAGRPLMAKLGMGCPVNKVTPAQAEAMRQRGLAGLRGVGMAPARPALGLDLDRMTDADVAVWAADQGLDCKSLHKGFVLLQCANVPASAVGEGPSTDKIEQATFAFSPEKKLISVQLFRRGLSGEAAAQILGRIRATLSPRLGAPTDQTGDETAAFLTSGPMKTVVRRYRYSDYVASITASNLPWSGIALSEQYMSAKPDAPKEIAGR